MKDKLLSPKELADELSVSKRWVLYQYANGTFPAVFRQGRVIRFNLHKVLEALAKA